MKLKIIEIENIKGIEYLKLELDLFPNKPIILVAPNGFGKSSLAIGFNSLLKNKLTIDKEENCFNNDCSNLPKIKITFENNGILNEVEANTSQNNISDYFDIFVINNQLKATAIKQRIGSNVIVKSSLDIQTTVLIKNIPQKKNFDYNITQIRKRLGFSGKILSRIDPILNNPIILFHLQSVNFKKFEQVRISKKINSILQRINDNHKLTTKQLKEYIVNEELSNLEEIEELKKIVNILSNSDITVPLVELYLSALQLIFLYQIIGRENFYNAIKYRLFLDEKNFYDQILSDFNSAKRLNIRTFIDKKKRQLIIKWPKAHQLSNGQRDILTFITLLYKVKNNFRKQNLILIIDEIFDYLDDANLVTFQYFISNFIEEIKNQNRNIFPVLLTHLDPQYFNHFVFNKHKLQIRYLKRYDLKSSKHLLKIIYKREEPKLKPKLDRSFFHYYPEIDDLENEFKEFNLNIDWSKSDRFRKRNERELRKYLYENKKYDPIAVCLALRLKIEEICYNKLKYPDLQNEFLRTKKTKCKLEFCYEKGIEVPEIFYLLGIIYNAPLHLKEGQDISIPISNKLENLIIKNMIINVFEKYDEK